MIERSLCGLDILEVGKSFQVGAQMLAAERALEAVCASSLRPSASSTSIRASCHSKSVHDDLIWAPKASTI
jgi:hypothetical protein